MARRKNRARSRGRSGRGGMGRPSAWVISSSGTDASGTATTPVNWGGASQTIAAGSTLTFQPVVLAPAVTAGNAPPSLGETDIVGLDCHFDVTSMTVGGLLVIGAALYVSEYNTNATKWAVRTPTLNTDAMRQDNIHIVAAALTVPVIASDAMPVSISLRLLLPYPIRIGASQALHCTIGNDTVSAGVISFTPFVRARIANVV